jgi:serine phosphatase RsbU (regulator of sigma subunit)
LFYTDGLLEHEKDYIAGEAALRSALSDVSVRQARSPARELRDRLVGRAHGDDISVLVIRREDDA